MYVSPTSEFIAENYKDLISKPSSLIVGNLMPIHHYWVKTRLIKTSLSLGLRQPCRAVLTALEALGKAMY